VPREHQTDDTTSWCHFEGFDKTARQSGKSNKRLMSHPIAIRTAPLKLIVTVPTASFSAVSGSFNSLFKVLFIFPSRYFFAIGFPHILIPSMKFTTQFALHSRETRLPRKRPYATRSRQVRDSHPRLRSFPRDFCLSQPLVIASLHTTIHLKKRSQMISNLSSSLFVRHY
jgi:hypothetical protein